MIYLQDLQVKFWSFLSLDERSFTLTCPVIQELPVEEFYFPNIIVNQKEHMRSYTPTTNYKNITSGLKIIFLTLRKIPLLDFAAMESTVALI